MILLLGGCGPDGVDGWFVDLHGRVVDEASAPVTGARVRLSTGQETVGDVETDADGAWRLPVYGESLLGNELVALFEADGLADLRARFPIDLRAPVATHLEAGPWQTWQSTERRFPTLRLAPEAEAASVYGQVVDAVSGAPVSGLALLLQRGWNASPDDPAEAETTTDDAGRFVFTSGPPGWYTVASPATGSWAATRFPAFLTRDGGEALGAASPPLGEGQLRAAITWGAQPLDLDLHLSAPLKGGQAGEDGNGRYHVFAGEPTHPDMDPGSGFEAAMELTANAGRGPETVAIYTSPGSGEIHLSVLDMDHYADATNDQLAEGGVVMQVWDGTDARYHTISPAETATWWSPMVIDADTGTVYASEVYAVDVVPGNADAF